LRILACAVDIEKLAHLLGIEQMHRIRNWKELDLCRSNRQSSYAHIDVLFSEYLGWA
jgi:hypothetical protein